MSRGETDPFGPTESMCPRCQVPLFEGRRAESKLRGCGHCGGVWLDVAAAQAVVSGAARDLTALAAQAAAHSTVSPDVNLGPLPCPVCGLALGRVAIPGTAIEIDSCAAHGSWFDADELRLVALAYAEFPPPLRFRREDYRAFEDAPRRRGFTVSWSDDSDNDGPSLVSLALDFVDDLRGRPR
jgi:Zn-finger nucleic acid-binding protein